ncbi:hypothetical protein FGG08_003204 [Glutinoglossum americanum]|uniref:Uncharacterized protein n=1 Tax=Glutinoglossum americanum TaxID=1670608 RepID=A0A9P8L3U4_9PEZI|nr:hypothetical protein FGG08_003204 [Glutinoglossum americanum]
MGMFQIYLSRPGRFLVQLLALASTDSSPGLDLDTTGPAGKQRRDIFLACLCIRRAKPTEARVDSDIRDAPAIPRHIHLLQVMYPPRSVPDPFYTAPGMTDLHWAAGRGNVVQCYSLLQAGLFVDGRDSEGSTPLHYATYYGQLGATRFLVEHGADIHAVGRKHANVGPMAWAVSKGFSDVVSYLASVAVSRDPAAGGTEAVRLPPPTGKSADDTPATISNIGVKSELHWAAQRGEAKKCLELLLQGVHVDCRDENGETPLHFAAFYGSLTVTCMLVARGADINTTGFRYPHGTPLEWAKRQKHSKIEGYLVEMGAKN